MAKSRKIFIEYLTIDNEKYENNKIRIACNSPRYDEYKELFLYELFYHDFLENRIRDVLSKNFYDYQFYDSFLVQLTIDEFNEMKYLFEQQSELEKMITSDEMNRMLLFLNASVKMAQKEPGFWDV